MATIPVVRAPRFRFDADFPRYWHGGSAFATAVGNGLNFVFPAGERFFIRSVRHFLPRVADPALRARVEAFVGQEAQHQRAHLAAFAALEAQGYEIRSFLDWYERLAYGRIEPRTSPALRLATTAALEHFTATFGELALGTELLDAAHPEMRDLLRWHAAEEIEHKAVAFDVFQEVDGRYSVRVLGLALALVGLTYFWAEGTRHFLAEEEARFGTNLARAARTARANPQIGREKRRRAEMFRAAVRAYLRPDFHPSDVEDYELARGYLSSIGRLEG